MTNLIKRLSFAFLSAILILMGLIPINLVVWIFSLIKHPHSSAHSFVAGAAIAGLVALFFYYQYHVTDFVMKTASLFFGVTEENSPFSVFPNRIYRAKQPETDSIVVGLLMCPNNIDQNTVDLYTGVDDKNGNMIFEGDIIRVSQKNKTIVEGVVSFEHGAYIVVVPSATPNSVPFSLNDGFYQNFEYTILGNVHENPNFFWRSQ